MCQILPTSRHEGWSRPHDFSHVGRSNPRGIDRRPLVVNLSGHGQVASLSPLARTQVTVKPLQSLLSPNPGTAMEWNPCDPCCSPYYRCTPPKCNPCECLPFAPPRHCCCPPPTCGENTKICCTRPRRLCESIPFQKLVPCKKKLWPICAS